VERDHGSAGGGCGELSHQALDDRHENGAKPDASGGRFSRAVQAVLYPLYMFARRRGHSPDDAHRLRKRCTALFRDEVGRTVSDPAEIDEEIHALCDTLVASEGRLGP
jgi:hypothetical protein